MVRSVPKPLPVGTTALAIFRVGARTSRLETEMNFCLTKHTLDIVAVSGD